MKKSFKKCKFDAKFIVFLKNFFLAAHAAQYMAAWGAAGFGSDYVNQLHATTEAYAGKLILNSTTIFFYKLIAIDINLYKQ